MMERAAKEAAEKRASQIDAARAETNVKYAEVQ